MIIIRSHVWSLRRTIPLVAYLVSRYLRSHWHLRHIDAQFFGEPADMYSFRDAARRAWLALQDRDAAPLIHIYGGSSYGADLTRAEMTRWLQHLIKGLELRDGIWALHYHHSGRLDFHILTGNVTVRGDRLHNPGFAHRMRTFAREATSVLNQARLESGRVPIGNLNEAGEVFFLEPPTRVKPHHSGGGSSSQTEPVPSFAPVHAPSVSWAVSPEREVPSSQTPRSSPSIGGERPTAAKPAPKQALDDQTDKARTTQQVDDAIWVMRVNSLWNRRIKHEREKRRKELEKWEEEARRINTAYSQEFLETLRALREVERLEDEERQRTKRESERDL